MMSDYCSYWYRKAIDEIRVGARIGMVSTNTIRQTNTRESSLDLVVKEGGEIFNAIYEQKWSGASKVLVSIVNFVNKDRYIPQEDVEEAKKSEDYCARQRLLDGKKVDIISPRLLSFNPEWEAKSLNENSDLAFVGCQPGGKGFFLTEEEVISLIAKRKNNSECIKRYLGGSDIPRVPDNQPRRYIIDFANKKLEQCTQYVELLEIVKKKVKPERDYNNRTSYKDNWWRFQEPQMSMRVIVLSKAKFIAICMTTKYPVFAVIDNREKDIIPSNKAVVIAWQGWEKFGVLQSVFHKEWFDYQCSTLKADPTYNNTFVFETFPFPYAMDEKIGIKAELLHGLRKAACTKENFGLTELYNQIEMGAYKEIKKIQKELDKLVAKAYGFPVSKIKDREEIVRFLLEENKKRYEAESIKLDKSA